MKKLLGSKIFWYIIINAGIACLVAGNCVFTALFYKEVPVSSQHIFGDNLHNYLIYEHSMSLVIGILCSLFCNISFTSYSKE